MSSIGSVLPAQCRSSICGDLAVYLCSATSMQHTQECSTCKMSHAGKTDLCNDITEEPHHGACGDRALAQPQREIYAASIKGLAGIDTCFQELHGHRL